MKKIENRKNVWICVEAEVEGKKRRKREGKEEGSVMATCELEEEIVRMHEL